MKRLIVIGLDLVVVVLFAIIGRASHGESLGFSDILRTAMPFVAGMLIGSLFLIRRHASGLTITDGVWMTAITLVLGMTFRVFIGDSIAVAFILVAAAFLALFLIGWRALYALWLRTHPESAAAAAKAKDPRKSGNPAVRSQPRDPKKP